MGDGKAVTSTSATASSTSTTATAQMVGGGSAAAAAAPRVTARRSSRFQTRAQIRSFNVERAPIVIEFGATVIRVGYAEESRPKHLIPIEAPTIIQNNTNNRVQRNESQWYSILSPWIQQVYDRLMCNPTTRRVVVVHQEGALQYCPTAWLEALLQILWNKGVPAVVTFSSLELLPIAQGWKRGLIVQVSRAQAVCVCHADGHVLPFTYQSVPCGYQQLMEDETKLQRTWTDSMEQQLLNENNPNSLVVALLKCLEACPRDIRPYVVGNLIFSGDGMMLLPDLGRRVSKRVEQVLEGNQEPLEMNTKEQGDDTDEKLVLGMVPIDISSLKPLASRLQMTSCAPHRPDFISWIGSSLWAATWNKYDDEETRIQWKFAPKD